MNVDEKQCPFCAETIKTAAKICRFCNRDVSPAASDVPTPAAAPTSAPMKSFQLQNPTATSNNQAGGVAGLVIFLIFGGFWAWNAWIAPAMNNPGTAPDPVAQMASVAQVAAQTAGSDTVTLDAQNVKSLAEGKYGQPVLTGVVVNTTSRPLRYIQAEAEFSDKNGSMVATGLDNTTDTLQPGDKWRFEVIFPSSQIKSGQITKVTGRF